MKCRKCNLAERHGSLAYCLPCNAAYLKEYREKKKVKMDEPIKGMADFVEKVKKVYPNGESPYPRVIKEMNEIAATLGPVHPALKNPLYLSYYVRPGTDLHRELIEAEKVYEVEGRI